MKKYLLGIVLFGLLGIWAVLPVSYASAKQQDITVENGAYSWGAESGPQVSALNYFVGDVGKLVPGTVGTTIDRMEYQSNNTSVVTVDAEGNYKIVGAGSATVTLNGYDVQGTVCFHASYLFMAGADLSGSSLDKTKVTTYMIYGTAPETVFSFKDMPQLTYYTYDFQSSNPDMSVYVNFDAEKKQLTVAAYDAGTTQIQVTINNQTFTFTYSCAEVTINKASAVMVKGKTTKLKVKGYSGKIVWKTTKKSVATINSKGKIKAKKNGNAVVYAQLGNQRIGCAVSVVTAKRKKVINKAKSVAKGTYSQPRRMQKGYYDCSSLVWLAYRKEGKTFGNRAYAPVAAEIAKNLISKNKRIKGGLYAKNIQGLKFRPGDLMFETGAKNGRYKGIYHVEMFAGYECTGFTDKGKPIVSTLWANRPANYYYGAGCVMARP